MKTIWILLIAGIASYAPTATFAQPQQSENFRITKSVLDAGGGASSSANFQLVSAFGQPTPIGVSSSTNFTLYAGFLTPAFGVSPASPIDLVIRRQPALSNDMKLDWSAVPGADFYTIYRDVTAIFTPGPGNQIGTSGTNSFIDVGAVGLPAIKYFYIVTASSNGGMMLSGVPSHPIQRAKTVSEPDNSSRKAAEPVKASRNQEVPKR